MRGGSRVVAPAVSLTVPFAVFVASVVLYVALGSSVTGSDPGAPSDTTPSVGSHALPEETSQPGDSHSSPSVDASPAPPTETHAPSSSAARALAKLDTVTTAHAGATGYLRAAFGDGWGDTDRNGCDARNDVLGRDLTDVVHRANTNGCVVHSGVLVDPYTGKVIQFLRGNETSQLVQIDHVVPLAWAWRYGAANWTHDERVVFHNDQANLLAVDGASNMEKSDSGPGDWMPANRGAHCSYATTFVDIVHEYALSIPDHDRQALERTLASCS